MPQRTVWPATHAKYINLRLINGSLPEGGSPNKPTMPISVATTRPAVTWWPISKANKHFTRSRVQRRAPFYWKWHLIKPQVGTDSVWPQSNTKNRAADLFVFWPHAKKLLAWLEFPTRKWDIWRLNFPSAEKGEENWNYTRLQTHVMELFWNIV